MKFPWEKYEEVETNSISTLQIFITNKCNMRCDGCFVRNVMSDGEKDVSIEEYKEAVSNAYKKGVQKINLLGGEPFLHPHLIDFVRFNSFLRLKTTIYTNGRFLNLYSEEDLIGAKIRVSIYSFDEYKSIKDLKPVDMPIEICFMVSNETTVEELLKTSCYIEDNFDCSVFFLSSIRELDNKNKEFFDDTSLTMPILEYKKIVHEFLENYDGNMEIHVSKRGVFESTLNKTHNKCKFSNYFIGNKIIQCPYDTINLRYQKDYSFNDRFCQQNNTCLMSKIVFKKRIF